MSISLSPVALTARQLVNEHTPRVLPWAVFLLGLRPVIARNHCCYTLPWVILFLGFRLVIACNRGCCTFRRVIFLLGLHPAIAHTRGYCTLFLAISLLGLRPVFACNIAASHSAGLFSLWGFAPLLPIIVVTAFKNE